MPFVGIWSVGNVPGNETTAAITATSEQEPAQTCCHNTRCFNYYGGNPEAVAWAYDAFGRGVHMIGAVFLSTALLRLAEKDAGCADLDDDCKGRVHGFTPSSLLTIMATVSGFLSAIVMPLVGAIVDHTPHRRTVAICSAVLMVALDGVMATVSQSNWFFVAIVATFSSVIFLVHLVVIFAYLPDLTEDQDLLTRYTGSYVAIRSLAMMILLLVVIGVSSTFPGIGEKDSLRFDVGTARISQVIMTVAVAVCSTLTFWGGLKERAALSEVPEGQTLLSTGFSKLVDTSRLIWKDFSALKWYCLAVIFYGSPTSALIPIAVTFTTDFLQMNSTENGVVILSFLTAAIIGSKVMPHFAQRLGLLNSMKVSILAWAVAIAATGGLIRGPQQKDVFYAISAVWGMLFGWIVPNGRMIYIALIPKGQESEMMGLFQFFARAFLWIPALLFTASNEIGVKMTLSLQIVPLFFVVCFFCLQRMGSFIDAVEYAKEFESTANKQPDGTESVLATVVAPVNISGSSV